MMLTLLKKWGFTSEKLINCLHHSIRKGLFPDFLKRANSATVHKNNDPLGKRNDRLVSMLRRLSRVCEGATVNQVSELKPKFLNKSLVDYVKFIVPNKVCLNSFKRGKEGLVDLVIKVQL